MHNITQFNLSKITDMFSTSVTCEGVELRGRGSCYITQLLKLLVFKVYTQFIFLK